MNTGGHIPKPPSGGSSIARLDRCCGCHLLTKQLLEQLKASPNINANITINVTSEVDPKEIAERISKMIADAVKRGVASV